MTTSFDLHAMALLLRQGRRLNSFSLGLLALTGLWLLFAAFGYGAMRGAGYLLGGSIMAGLLQFYYATRVDFDAGLLMWAARERDLADAAATLDASMQALNLVPPERGGRDWSERIGGARRLLLRQALSLAAQLLLLAVAWWLAVQPLNRGEEAKTSDNGRVALQFDATRSLPALRSGGRAHA